MVVSLRCSNENDAIQDDAIQDDAIQDDAIQDDAIQDDAIQDDAIQDDAIQDDAIPAIASRRSIASPCLTKKDNFSQHSSQPLPTTSSL
jgi:hypothetical protein